MRSPGIDPLREQVFKFSNRYYLNNHRILAPIKYILFIAFHIFQFLQKLKMSVFIGAGWRSGSALGP